jgi:hypothetical protein
MPYYVGIPALALLVIGAVVAVQVYYRLHYCPGCHKRLIEFSQQDGRQYLQCANVYCHVGLLSRQELLNR